ncbi:lysosomal alpha-glucosidase isoform X2 [Rhipicephalus microplus]|uniref:lysosomal alpha-glucosidase isoform X2 n=1 Tax=Rhipicephalus microplus TaxID=6941 RepID=UPI003F6A58CA
MASAAPGRTPSQPTSSDAGSDCETAIINGVGNAGKPPGTKPTPPGTNVNAVTSPEASPRKMESPTFTYFPGRAGEAKKGLQESSLELLASIPEESSLSPSSGNLHRSLRGPLLCALVSLLLSATVLASCAVLAYVELFYRWSFPLRVDCDLDPTREGLADYGRCLRRGCKYVSTDSALPMCFFPEDYGYVMVSQERHANGSGFTALLKRPALPPLFGGEFEDVVVNVSFFTPSRLRVQMVPDGHSYHPIVLEEDNLQRCNENDTGYELLLGESGRLFGIAVTRKENGAVIFDTRLPGTVLSKQFLQVSTRLTTANIFGLGGLSPKETLKQDINWKTVTFFNKRINGRPSDYFGVHHFYMVVEEDGKANGLFLRNGNAMDVLLQPEKVITFRTTGGLLDFDIFLGDSPDDVLRQFTELVGRPAMPPLWALGHHVSVAADVEISQVWRLLQMLNESGIEVAALHINKGIANGKLATNDSLMAKEMFRLQHETQYTNIRYLLRADPLMPSPGVHMIPLIENEGGESSTDNAFVDFTNPETMMAWTNNLRSLYGTFGFDGLLLDMNEPTYPPELNRSSPMCSKNKWNNPPYHVGFQHWGRGMFENSVCGDANQSAGIHYDMHNLYGYHHSKTTWQSLVNLTTGRGGQRPMILSRATFSGSGSFGGHWFEEEECSWEGLRRTIVKAVKFSMLGMPLVGGYCHWSNESEDVRLAWHEVSALLPLSIRRMGLVENLEEDEVATRLLNASAGVLATRKRLLPYMYTVFYEAHVIGGAVLRALFYEYPTDPNAMTISHQFLWGSALLVSPKIQEDAPGMEGYFPAGQWCDFYAGESINLKRGGDITLNSENVALHVRGGFIIPLLRPVDNRNSSVKELELFISPDENGDASGFLFWDDGITYHADMTKAPATLLNFTLFKEQNASTLAISAVEKSSHNRDVLMIQSVTFCNVASPVSVLLDGKTVETSTYDSNLKVLWIESLFLDATNHTLVMNS